MDCGRSMKWEWNGKKSRRRMKKKSEWETPKNRYVFEQWPGMLLIWWNGKKVSRPKRRRTAWNERRRRWQQQQCKMLCHSVESLFLSLCVCFLWIQVNCELFSQRCFGLSPFAVACTHNFHITRLKLFNWTFIIYQTRLCVVVVVVCIICE